MVPGADNTILANENGQRETYSMRHRLRALRNQCDFLNVQENPAAQIRMRPFKRIALFKEPHREQIADPLAPLNHPQAELELRNRLFFKLLYYGSGIPPGRACAAEYRGRRPVKQPIVSKVKRALCHLIQSIRCGTAIPRYFWLFA
ncbi:MAG: hypothetical protein JW768_11330 [Chitinispirillaceae bacterium]|nr:hypothetical protein [Chitinispirillaceae bacterium]